MGSKGVEVREKERKREREGRLSPFLSLLSSARDERAARRGRRDEVWSSRAPCASACGTSRVEEVQRKDKGREKNVLALSSREGAGLFLFLFCSHHQTSALVLSRHNAQDAKERALTGAERHRAGPLVPRPRPRTCVLFFEVVPRSLPLRSTCSSSSLSQFPSLTSDQLLT